MFKLLSALLLIVTASLSAETKVLAFAGSTHQNSLNKKLVANAAHLAENMGASVTLIDLKDFPMPMFDPDLEAQAGIPDNVEQLRQLMVESDVIFIASPEYNASVTGVLKNTIDWLSRKDGSFTKIAFQGKKFAIMSASTGARGGIRGLAHLRTILENLGSTVMQKQMTLPFAAKAFDSQGNLLDPKVVEELQQLVRETVFSK